MNFLYYGLLMFGAVIGGVSATTSAIAASMDGSTVYSQRCAACHDNATERTPPRATLQRMPPEEILAALTKGSMQAQATGLSTEEIRAVASFVSGRSFADAQSTEPKANPCTKAAGPIDLGKPSWMGWGNDIENTRYQPKSGLKIEDVPRLKVKWAYAYHGRSAYGQPSIVGDHLFVTHSTGKVSALNANTGCEFWSFDAPSAVRTAVSVAALPKTAAKNLGAKHVAFFGTASAIVFAVDADTGRELWQTKVDDHVVARITGSPTYYDGRLYVPVSSNEEPAAGNPKYPCCTFRGSIVALDILNGKVIWKAYGIVNEPKPSQVNSAGTQMFGPAGGAIWSAPTIDAKRGLVYASTGNSYTEVDTDGSDAVVAFDIKTGQRVWANQVTANDNYLMGCPKAMAGKGNCPKELGPDFDIGTSPLLRTLSNGKQVLVVGQKSGMVFGLDPANEGKTLWKTKVGFGSALGGVQWGPAADSDAVYVAVADTAAREAGTPGLYALKLDTGEQMWNVPTPAASCAWTKGNCRRAQSAAVTAIPGVAFSGAFDGHIRAYATKDGAIIWDYDTGPALDTVNGAKVEGGTFDSGGATIANGILFVNSGYGFIAGKSGRLLIAFSVDGK